MDQMFHKNEYNKNNWVAYLTCRLETEQDCKLSSVTK